MRRHRQRQSPPDRRFAGTHFEDPFLEWLKGHVKREEAVRDVTRLSNELMDLRHAIFPIRSVPVEDHPGYVTHDRNFFKVQFENGKTNKNLTEYFCDEHYRDGVSYGNAHDLGEFFELALHGLVINGSVIYAVEWEKIQVNDRYYTLPTTFHWVNTATAHINKNDKENFLKQKFSFITKKIVTYYEYSDKAFREDETFILKYPGFPIFPVASSLKYIKDLSQGMDFSLTQGQANIEPLNHSLPLEITRYKTSTDKWRKQHMTRVKVSRIFKQPVGGQGIPLTTYYQVFAYAEYKKHLNTLRDYFMKEFNEQIMKRVQEKNNFATPMEMVCTGFTSNEDIDRAFDKYEKGEINSDQFVEKLKDDYGLSKT